MTTKTSAAGDADLRASLASAARSPLLLHYAPEEIVPGDTVFDLCDEAQASLAGLDPGDPGAHDAIGIDCASSRRRFAYKPRGDALYFADSYAEAQARLDAIAPQANEAMARGIALGSFGVTLAASALPLEPAGRGFAVAPTTRVVADGKLRGLVANTSSQVAHEVTFHLGEHHARYPLSVQPGETVAFEVPAPVAGSASAQLQVAARFVPAADDNRRVLVGGAPGRWSGSREAFARIRPDLADDLPDAPVRYFETTLLAVQRDGSEWHGEGAPNAPALRAPTVVAAALDADGRVLAVLRPNVMRWGDESAGAAVLELPLGDEVSVGFLVPPATEDVLISAGGADVGNAQ